MAVFEFRGRNQAGESITGTLSGASLAAAAATLEQRGLTVEHLAPVEGHVEEAAAPQAPPTGGPAGPPMADRNYVQTHVVGQIVKVPLADIGFFFRQLATMLHAGVGMVQTLDTLSKQTHDFKLKAAIRETNELVREGKPLSMGLERYPDVFTPLMLALVRTGERSGMLVDVLRQLSDYIDREIKLRQLIRRVTIYPKLVIGASIFIICVTNWIVGAIGGKGLIQSPLTNWSTWVCLAPWIIGLWVFFKFIQPNPAMKVKWDRFLIGIPYFGTTSLQLAMAKFGRAFAALYRGGLPPHDATLMAADSCGNEHVRELIYPAAERVKNGESMSTAFAQTGTFTPMVLDMIHTGETTGNMDTMLEKVAEYYEGDSETRATASGYVLGVVALVLVGIYVAYVVINFYVGYFSGITNAAG